jgi:hypothetical protein
MRLTKKERRLRVFALVVVSLFIGTAIITMLY